MLYIPKSDAVMNHIIDGSKTTISRLFPGKRTIDQMVSVSLFPFILSVIGLTALAMWIIHGWPRLFAQERLGLYGQPFTLYKFRTMTNDRGPDGELLLDTDRLTRFGKLPRGSKTREGNFRLSGTIEKDKWLHEVRCVPPRLCARCSLAGRTF